MPGSEAAPVPTGVYVSLRCSQSQARVPSSVPPRVPVRDMSSRADLIMLALWAG
jgi:hypothetical protein